MRDKNFGDRGEAATQFIAGENYASAVVIQPDRKIVAAGYIRQTSYPFASDFALARYNQDGTLDNSFGSVGKVVTAFGYINDNYNSAAIYGLALQADGKIVAAGVSIGGFTLVRYNGDGSIDTSFGNNGKVTTSDQNFAGVANAVALQTDGKIIVVGSVRTSMDSNGHTALARYNADGSPDNSFGNNGKVVTVIGYSDSVNAIVIQPDGKIVVGGSYYFQEGSALSDSALTRYNPNGTPDSSFGVNGTIKNTFGESKNYLSGLVLQPDGKIIVGGNMTTSGTYPAAKNYPIFARFNNGGSLDQSFGTNGTVVETHLSPSNISAMTAQSDGKILAVGSASGYLQVFRYNLNGTPDESFGIFGRASGRLDGTANAVGIQADGKIISAGTKRLGFTNGNQKSDFMLARFLNGQGRSIVKYDFDGDGKSDISVFRSGEGIWYLNQSNDGMRAERFGSSTDKLVPADYDGDGKTDVAVYRSGTWYLQRSQMGFTAVQFGEANDIPLPTDFDDDGQAELLVFRTSNNTWYQLNLATNQFKATQFGQPNDKPFIYKRLNNLLSPELGVYRNGKWIIQNFESDFGAADDIPVPADYDGDGYTDRAVFRPSNGTWYISESSGYRQITFGMGNDIPVPADYDGDGKTDIAVNRNGTWYINRSAKGFTATNFGVVTDRAIADTPAP